MLKYQPPKYFGASIVNGDVFRLWAPNQNRVSLLLEGGAPVPMQNTRDGWHELLSPVAKPGTRYRFLLEGGLEVPLNRAFHADRVASDTAWRKVKPFKKVDEAVVRYLNTDEARRLVQACPEDFGKLVQGALLTGCRYSELTRLKAGNFNGDSGTLAIRLAKGKILHVVLTDEGRRSFTQWTENLIPTDHVFLRADNNRWGASHQKRPLDDASERAKIEPAVTFHILRHTHGSQLAMAGVPMGVIAAQLGHADTRMTEKHYAHLAPSYIAQTIRANFPVLNLASESQVVPLRRRFAT